MNRARTLKALLPLALLSAWGLSPRSAQAVPTIDLMWDQAFTSTSDTGVAAVEVAPILISNTDASITTTSEMRLVIPSSYQMAWDTSDTVCEILLSGTGAVTAAVSSWPATGAGAGTMKDHVAMFDVTTTFASGTRLVITGLTVKQWTEDETAAPAGNYRTLAVAWNGLDTTPDGSGDASATQLWTSSRVTMSSASNWSYSSSDTTPTLPSVTVTEASSGTLSITAGNDIRIRIPAAAYGTAPTFASFTALTITGSGANKVSSTLATDPSGSRIVLIDVTQNFAAGESITIAGLKITTPSAAYTVDSLELILDGGTTNIATTDRRIFTIGPPTCAVSTMTDVTASVSSMSLTADVVLYSNTASQFSSTADLRLMIMPNSTAGGSGQGRDNLTWTSNQALTATVSGGTGGAMAATVNLDTVDTGTQATEITANGRCIVLDVGTSFSAGSQITISGLKVNNSVAAITRLYIGLIHDGYASGGRTGAFGTCSALATEVSTGASAGGSAGNSLSAARGGGGVCFLKAAERSAPQ